METISGRHLLQSSFRAEASNTMDRLNLMRVLLLTCLLLTDVRCKKNAEFVYRSLGSDALLTCRSPQSLNCSLISWTFYKDGRVQYSEEVNRGQVRVDSDRSSRMSITSSCSLILRHLIVDDVGSYVCLKHGEPITAVYLSVLTITSLSTITDMQPGGNLSLSCILFTYYDSGSCRSYSSNIFDLSWTAEDGTVLSKDTRFKQIVDSRCNITLVTELKKEDNNRKWRCQVNTSENIRAAFLDFTSTFLFQNPPTDQNVIASATCPVVLPISHIVLCVALPVMVLIVGVFTVRGDKKRAKTSAAGIELLEIK